MSMNTQPPPARVSAIAFAVVMLAGISLTWALRQPTHAAARERQTALVMFISPGGHLDLDHAGGFHLSALAGWEVRVAIHSLDSVAHQFVIPSLHVAVTIAPSPRAGVSTVTTFDVQFHRAGTYRWSYVRACGTASSRTRT